MATSNHKNISENIILPLFTSFDTHWQYKGIIYETHHEQHKAVLFTFQNVKENQIYCCGLAFIDMMHHTAHRDCTHVAECPSLIPSLSFGALVLLYRQVSLQKLLTDIFLQDWAPSERADLIIRMTNSYTCLNKETFSVSSSGEEACNHECLVPRLTWWNIKEQFILSTSAEMVINEIITIYSSNTTFEPVYFCLSLIWEIIQLFSYMWSRDNLIA